ncbi:hypothetical protein P5G65_14300 [Paenibacillus chondroitinus]|uniref:DUF3221 domain-containing protein n=1 Tax=Paenibacillus chondroitinus TaxID=59842 RepID=A0ABU6DBH0_9BACL|nr:MULTISPECIES: hypothetical protein [Paenibacillus]MCY9660462.1 hypothetical protein [Paenibacillus anseongense]MEB4795073.1 hypothetical protein [Paenibacillus chondroitinus]
MAIKKTIIILSFIICIAISGCTKKTVETPIKYHHFQSKIFSTVNQKGKNAEGIRMMYTVSLTEFHPIGEEFERFNANNSNPGTNGFIVIDNKTKIFKVEADTKTEIDPQTLKKGDIIDFWVYIYNYDSGVMLVADEISLIN